MWNESGGKLVVISGPSGVGKSTVCSELLKLPKFERVITSTTRPPRPGEKDGEHYHFLDKREFEEGLRENQFLEHAVVHGHLYGTPRKAVEEGIEKGRYVLLNIDVKGAEQFRAKQAQLTGGQNASSRMETIFLVPPDVQTLEKRLRGRGTDTEKEIAHRLETARKEILEKDKYDHVVVSGDLAKTVGEILERIGYVK